MNSDQTSDIRYLSLPRAIKAAIDRTGMALSSVAFEVQITTPQLRRFLSGQGRLPSSKLQELCSMLGVYAVLGEPHDAQKKYTQNKEAMDAIRMDLLGRHVAFLSRRTKRDRVDVASGVLVQIGERVFIATAAHTIPRHQVEMFIISGQRDVDMEGTNVPIIKLGRFPADRPDVGYYEISADALAPLDKHPIDVSRVSIDPGVQVGRKAFVYGFPEDLVEVMRDARRRTGMISLLAVVYANGPLAFDEWPVVDADAPKPNRMVDVFIPYDRSERMVVWGIGSHPQLPRPSGLSGGGVWQGVTARSDLWSTEAVQLVAIQSAWSARRKYIRAARIVHWLRLIAADYPDLRRPLLSKFGKAIDRNRGESGHGR